MPCVHAFVSLTPNSDFLKSDKVLPFDVGNALYKYGADLVQYHPYPFGERMWVLHESICFHRRVTRIHCEDVPVYGQVDLVAYPINITCEAIRNNWTDPNTPLPPMEPIISLLSMALVCPYLTCKTNVVAALAGRRSTANSRAIHWQLGIDCPVFKQEYPQRTAPGH